MTLTEFKFWLEGFLDATGDQLSSSEVKIIREKLKKVNTAVPSKEPVYRTPLPNYIPNGFPNPYQIGTPVVTASPFGVLRNG